MAISKVVSGPVAALDGVRADMPWMLGGFALCGFPDTGIPALVRPAVPNPQCIPTNPGVADFGLGRTLVH